MTAANGGADPDARPERLWRCRSPTLRDWVGQVAAALKAQGVRCLYDADEQVRLRGTRLAEEPPGSTREVVVVVFVSADYAARDWTGWNAAPRSAGRLPRQGVRAARPVRRPRAPRAGARCCRRRPGPLHASAVRWRGRGRSRRPRHQPGTIGRPRRAGCGWRRPTRGG